MLISLSSSDISAVGYETVICSPPRTNELRLLPGLDERVLALLHRGLPLVAEPHLARRLLDLAQAERVLPLRDRDQFRGRVGNHLVLEVGLEPVGADRVADDGARALVAAPPAAPGRAGGPLSPPRRGEAHQPLANRARVARQRFVESRERIARPPGEHRVVPVVEPVPAPEHTAR